MQPCSRWAWVAVLVLAFGPVNAGAQTRLFWTEDGGRRIVRADVGHTPTVEARTVVEAQVAGAVGVDRRALVWADAATGALRAADGRVLVTGAADVAAVAVDARAGRVVWVEGYPGTLRQAPLAGGEAATVAAVGPYDAVALDASAVAAYVAAEGRVVRHTAGGAVVVAETGADVTALAVDAHRRRLYRAEGGRLLRSPLDDAAAAPDTLARNLGLRSLAVDAAKGALYGGAGRQVLRLDGRRVRRVADAGGDIGAVAASGGALYWIDGPAGRLVHRDGRRAVRLAGGLAPAAALAYDAARARLYWTDVAGNLFRTDADGRHAGSVVDSGCGPGENAAATLDPVSGRLFWGTDADCPGAALREAAVGAYRPAAVAVERLTPQGLVVDAPGRYVYWTHAGLYRKALEGGIVEHLVDGPENAQGVAVDAEYVYWTEYEGLLRRARLGAWTPETLLDSLEAPTALALDPTSGLLYWTERAGGRIRCARPDGTGLADVVAGRAAPERLVVARAEPLHAASRP